MIAADLAATVLTVKTDAYAQDKQDLDVDIATILNAELRELAGGRLQGDPDRGARDPQLRRVRRAAEVLDFLVDLFNHTVEGIDDAEIWIHTCWAIPAHSIASTRTIS